MFSSLAVSKDRLCHGEYRARCCEHSTGYPDTRSKGTVKVTTLTKRHLDPTREIMQDTCQDSSARSPRLRLLLQCCQNPLDVNAWWMRDRCMIRHPTKMKSLQARPHSIQVAMLGEFQQDPEQEKPLARQPGWHHFSWQLTSTDCSCHLVSSKCVLRIFWKNMWFTHSMMLNLFSGSCSASKTKKKNRTGDALTFRGGSWGHNHYSEDLMRRKDLCAIQLK